MRFSQIDRILEMQPGERLTAVKTLSLSEEYLKDHFPRFPVLPGVLMLEAAFQAAMYLVRYQEDFRTLDGRAGRSKKPQISGLRTAW